MSIESIEKIYNNITFSGWRENEDGSRSMTGESLQDNFLGRYARRWIPALLEVAKAAKEISEKHSCKNCIHDGDESWPCDCPELRLKEKLAALEARCLTP